MSLFQPRNRTLNRLFQQQWLWLLALIAAVLYITWNWQLL